jgi:ribonuclease T1
VKRTLRLLAAIALAAAVVASPSHSRTTAAETPTVTLAELPQEARTVDAAIREGGPFRYQRDGVVFGNFEKFLPVKPRGYYHEYTVPTPGAKNRGARRIVCGGPRKVPEVCYYSDDHYQSFRRIRE